jgi:hypothetical protein
MTAMIEFRRREQPKPRELVVVGGVGCRSVLLLLHGVGGRIVRSLTPCISVRPGAGLIFSAAESSPGGCRRSMLELRRR